MTAEKRARPRLVVDDTREESSIIASATVRRGGHLTFRGISDGNIVVEAGGRLTVMGMVRGAVINRGGEVEIRGTVERLDSTDGQNRILGVVRIANIQDTDAKETGKKATTIEAIGVGGTDVSDGDSGDNNEH